MPPEVFTNMQWAVLIIAAIAALGSISAAIGAFLSARATKLAAQGQLYANLLQNYSSKEMLADLKTLGTQMHDKDTDPRSWYQTWLPQWEKNRKILTLGRELNLKLKEAKAVDEARRYVIHYFFTALELYKNKALSEQLFQKICEGHSFELLYYLVVALEKTVSDSINKPFKKDEYIELLERSGRSETDKKRLQEAMQEALKYT